MKVVYANVFHDLARSLDCDPELVLQTIAADTRIGTSHMGVVHASGHTDKQGRGAGGHCFIKDFAALTSLYKEKTDDIEGLALLEALSGKNNKLLRDSAKDLDLLDAVYGEV
jgi:UDP-glucose 6-dehydrogenase